MRMKKDFAGTFESTIDNKNRFVLPSQLCKCLDNETDELFFVLAKSEEGEKYIKIIDSNIFGNYTNPLEVDSLKLAKQYNYSRMKLSQNHRIQLNKKEIEWLFGEGNTQNKLISIGLGDHIALTKKDVV